MSEKSIILAALIALPDGALLARLLLLFNMSRELLNSDKIGSRKLQYHPL